jgi:hypothetical protein
MTANSRALTAHQMASVKKKIWHSFTKSNGISIQEEALNYLLSVLTSFEGLDEYFEGMVAYCQKEQSKAPLHTYI